MNKKIMLLVIGLTLAIGSGLASAAEIKITRVNDYAAPFPEFDCDNTLLVSPLAVSGNGSGVAPPGQIEQYHVQIVWGDGAVDDEVPAVFTPSSGHSPYTFVFNATHAYTSEGVKNITVRLYHSAPPGNDGQADSVTSLTVCVAGPPRLLWTWARNMSSEDTPVVVSLTSNRDVTACWLDIGGSVYGMGLDSEKDASYLWNVPDFGNYTLVGYCNDTFGNTGRTTPAWYELVDETPPVLTWDWDDINSTITRTHTYICVNASESVECVLNLGGALYAGGSPGASVCWNVTALANRNHTASATCEDASGNSADTTDAWVNVNSETPDTTPPTLDWDWGDINSTITKNETYVCVNASEPVTCVLDFGGVLYPTVIFATNVCWDLEGLALGNYTASATCSDAAGNEATIGDAWVNIVAPPETIDLAITPEDITFSDETPDEEDVVTITATIRNLGNLPSGDFAVALLLDGIFQEAKIMSVNGSSFSIVEFEWVALLGDFNVTIVADYNNTVNESDETNNNATKLIETGRENERGRNPGGGIHGWTMTGGGQTLPEPEPVELTPEPEPERPIEMPQPELIEEAAEETTAAETPTGAVLGGQPNWWWLLLLPFLLLIFFILRRRKKDEEK